jgi:hypothetical protein
MRWHDRFGIMNDVIAESAVEFGIPAIEISRADRELIVASEAETLPELETTTARVVAIRHWAESRGGLGRAAGALGISRASLAEWAERRGLIAVRHRGKAGNGVEPALRNADGCSTPPPGPAQSDLRLTQV